MIPKTFTRLLSMFALPVAAVLLAACAADELAGQQGVNPPPAGGAVTGGTVSFTNNTSMTIGNGLDGITRAAWLTRGTIFPENEACDLKMPGQPSQDVIDAVTKRVTGEEEIETVTEPVVVESGATLKAWTINADIYVLSGGKLAMGEGAGFTGRGTVYVLSSGSVEFGVSSITATLIAYKGSTVKTLGNSAMSVNHGVKSI